MTHGDAVTIIVVMVLFVACFTWWGWKHILYGIFWPIIKFTFKAIIFTWWGGLILTNLLSQWMYRIWGFNLATLVSSDAKRWYESNFTPDCMWYPNWRVYRGLAPLPPDWDGPVDHLWPAWTFFALIGFFTWFFLRTKRKDNAVRHEPKRSDNEIYKSFADIIRPQDDDPRVSPIGAVTDMIGTTIDVTPRHKPRRDVDVDDDFMNALKGLGYKTKDIMNVAPKCNTGTLENRVRAALKLLSVARGPA